MALPTAYLVSTKKLPDILSAIQGAQAPPKFGRSFLEALGFTSSADRLVPNVFKALGLLTADGTPTERYFEFLDQTQGGRVLADGIREAYADLFQLNRNAQNMSKAELKGKIKTLTQGKASDTVVDKMSTTFLALSRQADWDAPPAPGTGNDALAEGESSGEDEVVVGDRAAPAATTPQIGLPFGGLVYSIQIQLPESRDQAVYDALFRSLKTHLLP